VVLVAVMISIDNIKCIKQSRLGDGARKRKEGI